MLAPPMVPLLPVTQSKVQAIANPSTEGVDLLQSKYNFKYLVFPNDLGMENNGHYMIININVPTRLLTGDPAGSFQDNFTALPGTASKVDTIRFGTGGSSLPLTSSALGNNGDTALLAIPRQTVRIAESIALYMPTPLVFNNQNVYEEVSLTALANKLGIGALTAAVTGSAGGGLSARALARLGGAVGKIASTLSSGASRTMQVLQSPINPAVEILFTTTALRQFTFELLMAPRNEKESITIKNIIKTLRFHGAPELDAFKLGWTWIPPAEFDITFFNKGQENMNILRINTCVLERIEVDYVPTSVYSTFSNGHPVAVRLSLGFREIEPIHKKRILQGF